MILFTSKCVLDLVNSYLPLHPIIVEAGAFKGQDTIRMATRWPKATVHSFEPVPALYNQLAVRQASYKNIHCYPLALSTQRELSTFYVSEKPSAPGIPSQASSLRKPKERLLFSPLHFPSTLQVQTITLDQWAADNNIPRIDFAWLDMQGHELSVLEASPRMLQTLKIIYLEVGFIEAYEKQPTYPTVKTWLESEGFKEIGRDFQNTTDWLFGNVLFARHSPKLT